MQRKNDRALIIFVKNPVKGKVKSRLARTIGEENALVVYQHLLEYTKKITAGLECDNFIFYDDFIHAEDLWPIKTYHKYLQQGNDLGERMRHAFQMIFDLEYKAAVIIGSDCYELKTSDIEAAFELLEEQDRQYKNDVVIGPAKDGGYYLLAMRKFVRHIFRGIAWSTPDVLIKTLQILQHQHTPYMLLPTLSDIDTELDLPDELKSNTGLSNSRN
ncbi:MAG: TIGR04282 family arsenosugar biosynthesis glycosyltransferase [Candidatus Saccharimonadales bacterium]